MEETMRAIAVLEPAKAALVRDVPMPKLKPYEALVRIHTCGFCNGTDMQIINGMMSENHKPLPTLLGHEGCGEAVEIGPKVRHIQLGDKFIRPDTPYQYGRYTCTFGNMADYAVAIDRQAMREDGVSGADMPSQENCGKIPADIPFEDGAVLLSMLECYSAVRNFRLQAGLDVLIYGAGPMGLGVAGCLKAIGARSVTMVDAVEERLQYAKDHFHVERTVNITREKLEDAAQKHSFDAVMDLVGSSKILLEGTHYLKQGGVLCGMGVLREDDALLDVTRLQNNTSLHMLNFPYQRLFYIDELTALIREGKLVPRHFYSHVLPAEEIDECIRLIRTKEALKVVLRFD